MLGLPTLHEIEALLPRHHGAPIASLFHRLLKLAVNDAMEGARPQLDDQVA